jgi:DNA repair protein SbcC/Rad50
MEIKLEDTKPTEIFVETDAMNLESFEKNTQDILYLQNQLSSQRSDYKNLLISYNKLSTAFRAHISANYNQDLIETIKELQSEISKLKNENKFYLDQLYEAIKENQADRDKNRTNNLAICNIQELVSQNIQLKQAFVEELNEKTCVLETQLDKNKEIIKIQEDLIKDLSDEISKLKESLQPDYELNLHMRPGEAQKKLAEALLDSLKKENQHLKAQNTLLKGSETKNSAQLLKAKKELIDSINLNKALTLQKNLLEKENTHLKTINKEIQSINVAELVNSTQSKLNDKYCRLKNKYFNAQKDANEYSKALQAQKEENDTYRQETEFLKEEIQRVKESNRKNCEDIQKKLENTDQDNRELIKSLKKVSDELDTIKKVTSKRISQLESALASKAEEIAKIKSIDETSLTKLVKLLQKSLSSQAPSHKPESAFKTDN